MCGRYTLSTPAQLVQEAFEAEAGPAVRSALAAGATETRPRWNVAPTQEAVVVRRREDGGRRLDLLRWGLAPARDDRGPAHVNARGETAATLAAFRDGFRGRRCLVPADGFYEWRRDGRARQPFHIRFADHRLFAFAGLWSPWRGAGAEPDRARGDAAPDGSFTILTCPPSAIVAPLHDRMPVILPPDAWEEWLAPQAERDALEALLVPWAAGGMETVPVDPWVNHAEHEGERCVRELTPAETAPRQLGLFG